MRWFRPRNAFAASGPRSFIRTCVMPPLFVFPIEFLSMIPMSSSPSSISTSQSIMFSGTFLFLSYGVE